MVNRTVWNPKGWKPGAEEEERPRPTHGSAAASFFSASLANMF